jgi:hypothetical protein
VYLHAQWFRIPPLYYPEQIIELNNVNFFIFAALMPKSFLKSQDPPDVPVKNWLTWSASMLEESISDASNKIAGVMGINKAGDIFLSHHANHCPKCPR